jgi:hypothetical protein
MGQAQISPAVEAWPVPSAERSGVVATDDGRVPGAAATSCIPQIGQLPGLSDV